MKIDFGQMISALSDMLDLVGIDEVQHGKRVGFMLWELARVMGMDGDSQKDLYRMGLLHDCGVSSTHVHKNLVGEMDWRESRLHCEIGADRLRNFPPLSFMSDVILHHHTHWEDLKKTDLPEHVKRSANLIFLSDRVDALAAHHLGVNLLEVKNDIREKIGELRHSFFTRSRDS